jgi:hypothetical protein
MWESGTKGFYMQRLIDLSQKIFSKLKATNEKIMFVESCTGGNAAGILVTHCAGISNYLYGSQVVYTAEAKAAWLGLDLETLLCHGTESEMCASLLALHAYKNKITTFSVVGHLNDDSFIYCSYAKPSSINEGICTQLYDLKADNRVDRMHEAIETFYNFILGHL